MWQIIRKRLPKQGFDYDFLLSVAFQPSVGTFSSLLLKRLYDLTE